MSQNAIKLGQTALCLRSILKSKPLARMSSSSTPRKGLPTLAACVTYVLRAGLGLNQYNCLVPVTAVSAVHGGDVNKQSPNEENNKSGAKFSLIIGVRAFMTEKIAFHWALAKLISYVSGKAH